MQTDSLNVRLGPGTDYPIVGQLGAGGQLALVGRNEAGDWLVVCCVDDDSRAGWPRAWCAPRPTSWRCRWAWRRPACLRPQPRPPPQPAATATPTLAVTPTPPAPPAPPAARAPPPSRQPTPNPAATLAWRRKLHLLPDSQPAPWYRQRSLQLIAATLVFLSPLLALPIAWSQAPASQPLALRGQPVLRLQALPSGAATLLYAQTPGNLLAQRRRRRHLDARRQRPAGGRLGRQPADRLGGGPG